jgi:hypothetical protein
MAMGRNKLQLNRVLKNFFIQPGQKGSRCQAREESARVGVLKQYRGAISFEAGIFPAQFKRNYHNRLLGAGWWQMGLFQQAVRT